jgi:hypothetical protein
MIDSLEDLITILPTIGVELYENMKIYIEENYKTAQQYKTFVINEKPILDIIEK